MEPTEFVVVSTTAATVVVALPLDPVVIITSVVEVTYVEPNEFDSVSTSTAADPAAEAEPEPEPDPVCGGIVLVNVAPVESVAVVTRATPEMPVLAALRRALRAASSELRFDEKTVGSADRKDGGVAAVRADSTMLLMSPVTEAAEAALCTATPKGTASVDGM